MAAIAVERKALVKALRALKGLTTKSSRLPILQSVKLTVNGALTVQTYNLDTGARVTLEGTKCPSKFERVVPMDAFLNAVRAGKSSRVSIRRLKDGVELDGKATLRQMELDFPALPATPKNTLARVPADLMAAAVRETAFAASTEVIRYALTGVLLERRGRTLRFVASDGKRLVRRDVNLAAKPRGKDFRLIFPLKALSMVGALAQGHEAVDIRTVPDGSVTRAHFVMARGREVYGRLVEGQFPDYEAVTPGNRDFGGELKEWTLPVAELLEGIKAVMPYTTDKTRAMRLVFDAERCKLFTRTQELGEGNAEVPSKGDALGQIILNPEYVMDYLKALPKGTAEVTLAFDPERKDRATLWKAHKGHTYVLMPLTITL